MSKDKDFSELLRLKDILYSAAEEMATEVLWEIEHNYESVIDRFYEHYDPLYYDRTYSTYLASSGYDNLYSSRNFIFMSNEYDVGININSKRIPGSPYRADKDWVFSRTFEKGIHGINTRLGWGSPKKKTFLRIKERERQRSYKVEQIIEQRRRQKGKNGEKRSDYIFKVKKHVTETRYYGDNPTESFTNSSKYYVKKKMYTNNASVKLGIMSNMIPAPRSLMNTWWKQFTTKRNLDKIWINVLNSKLG